MNVVTIIGRITKDPEIRYSQGATPTAFGSYTLAVDRPTRKDSEKVTDFIPCKCIGKAAEFAEKYLAKGMKMAIRGRMQIDNYTANDGSKRSTTYVLVEEHEFCESKNTQPKPQPSPKDDVWMSVPDEMAPDGLPFN